MIQDLNLTFLVCIEFKTGISSKFCTCIRLQLPQAKNSQNVNYFHVKAMIHLKPNLLDFFKDSSLYEIRKK